MLKDAIDLSAVRRVLVVKLRECLTSIPVQAVLDAVVELLPR